MDVGINLLDTSDVYGERQGENEELLGKAVSGRRDEAVVSTKFGFRFDAEDTHIDSGAKWARVACAASLKRLGLDYIDLYFLHRRNPRTPIEESVTAMSELVHKGDVRYIGLSEVSSATLRAAHAVHPITAVQVEYSIFTRFVERDLLETCRELGVGIIAYSPIGRGLLSGSLKKASDLGRSDPRRENPRFSRENLPKNLALMERVHTMANSLSCTPAQLALAWLLERDESIVPLFSTTRGRRLGENARSIDLRLPREFLVQLDSLADSVAGERFSPGQMRLVDQ